MFCKIKRVGNHDFSTPTYQHKGDLAVDLQANLEHDVHLYPGEEVLIGCGWSFAIPDGVGMFVLPRSGLGAKYGIILGNTVGVIDGGYRDEVGIKVWNRNTEGEPFTIHHGDRIAQAVFMPIVRPTFVEVEDLDTTDRNGGFGSSGI